MKKRYNLVTLIGLLLVTSALTFTFTFTIVRNAFNESLSSENDTNERLGKIISVLDIIKDNYIGQYDEPALIEGAVEGIVNGTGDRWSYYVSAEAYEQYESYKNNSFVGVGLSVIYDEKSGGMVVTKVHPGSSAESAGIKFRDVVVAVGGERVVDLGYADAVEKVRGAAGTEVTITVARDGTEQDFTMTRSGYVFEAITSSILAGDIGYMRIDNFDSGVDSAFANALNSLLDAGVKGLIFDVRNNPGGFKDAMIKMLDKLCPEGTLMIMRDKNGNEDIDTSDAAEVALPMVVIVNEDSYSAAEFFAAALQEYGKAEIIGTQTFGKGYSQIGIELGDGSLINLSTNEYFTPNGKSLIGVGVVPDHIVEFEGDVNWQLLDPEADNQILYALSLFS